MPRAVHLFFAVMLLGAPAHADSDDGRSDRHQLEIEVGGGLSWMSDMPERFDLGLGGVLGGRVVVDLYDIRVDGAYRMIDPTRPELFQVTGGGRLLFVTVHDFTWRRTEDGELLRLMAGFGGEFDLPDDTGHIMLDIGFAMARLGSYDEVVRQFSEAYGGYVGLTARFHFWEIRDELRVAVQAWMPPPDALSLDVEVLLSGLVGGATVSNRLYIQALREGPVSLGPELDIRVEQLPNGTLVLGTLGVSGTLGL